MRYIQGQKAKEGDRVKFLDHPLDTKPTTGIVMGVYNNVVDIAVASHAKSKGFFTSKNPKDVWLLERGKTSVTGFKSFMARFFDRDFLHFVWIDATLIAIWKLCEHFENSVISSDLFTSFLIVFFASVVSTRIVAMREEKEIYNDTFSK